MSQVSETTIETTGITVYDGDARTLEELRARVADLYRFLAHDPSCATTRDSASSSPQPHAPWSLVAARPYALPGPRRRQRTHASPSSLRPR